MIGDLARQTATVADFSKKPTLTHITIDLNSNPLKNGELPNENNKIRQTNLLYYLSYLPNSSTRATEKPYLVTSDLFPPRKVFRFATLEELREVAETDDRMAFFIKYVSITEEDLEVARGAIRFHFPLYFDRAKYIRDVKENAKKQGIEINGSVFLSEDMQDENVATNAIYLEISRQKGIENHRAANKRRGK